MPDMHILLNDSLPRLHCVGFVIGEHAEQHAALTSLQCQLTEQSGKIPSNSWWLRLKGSLVQVGYLVQVDGNGAGPPGSRVWGAPSPSASARPGQG